MTHAAAEPALASVLDRFQPSKISEISSLTTRLLEEGKDIINLSIGEPDFETPDNAIEAGVDAIRTGGTKYTPVDGTSAMKQAIREKFLRDNELDYPIGQIIAASGAKPLLAHAVQALLDPGDEVVIPTPCWVSHPGMVRLFGGEPVFVACPEAKGFKLQPEDLEQAITEKTKLVIMNSPSNPTGATYNEAELKALTDVLLRCPRVWIIADDIYEHIVFDGLRFVTPAQVEPKLYERTLTVNGVSKGYAMTGWRIGFAGGPKRWIDAMRKVMSQSTGNPASISQIAATEALNGPQDFLKERAASFKQRRDYIVPAINQTPHLKCEPPEGSFFLYINCEGVLGRSAPDGRKIESSTDFAKYLLEGVGVSLVPGVAFELDPYVRLSYAVSMTELEEAATRLRRACSELT